MKKEITPKKLVNHVKSLNYNGKEIQSHSLLENKSLAEHVTRSSCWRPDIYLNNDRFCNGCIIYDNCCCPIKRIDKKRPNEYIKKVRKKA